MVMANQDDCDGHTVPWKRGTETELGSQGQGRALSESEADNDSWGLDSIRCDLILQTGEDRLRRRAVYEQRLGAEKILGPF